MPKEANQVTVERAQEILQRFKAEPPTATNYFPDFRDDVEVLGQGVPPAPVNPNYCLSLRSTLQLMVILADLGPVAYLDPPQIFASGSTFYYSAEVPWLRFANGAVRNAGQLAVYWISYHGDPGGRYAEENARLDLAWG
jgi:hypothetical protein